MIAVMLAFGAIVLAAPNPSAAYVHDVWTSDDGLPVDHTTGVAQTPDGFLWVSTVDGLLRYDGREFERFTVRNSDLPANRISDIETDDRGRLWIRTENQHTAYRDPDSGLFVLVDQDASHSRGAFAIRGEVAWFSTSRGLARFGDKLEIIPLDPGVTAIALYPAEDRVWIATPSDGVLEVIGTEVRHHPGLATESPRSARDIFADGDNVWLATTGGVDWLHDGAFERVTLDGEVWDARIASFDPLENGVLVQTNGLFTLKPGGEPVYVPNSGSERMVAPQLVAGPYTLATDRILRDGEIAAHIDARFGSIAASVLDHEGSLWFATRQRGLHRLRETPIRTVSVEEGLCARNIVALAEHEGEVWAGSQDGALCQIGGAPGTAQRRTAHALFQDRDGRLIVGGDGGEVGTLGGDVLRAYAQRNGKNSVLSFADADDGLWIGRLDGLWFRTDDGVSEEIGIRGPIRFIHRRTDELWISVASRGLFRGTRAGFSRVDGFPSDFPRGIHETPEGVLWVATEDMGLVRVDPETGTSSAPVGSEHGLPSDGAHYLLADDHGWLWGSTNQGLFRVQPDTLEALAAGESPDGSFHTFTTRDGMRSREGNGLTGHGALRRSDGTLWFATQDGVVVVHPDFYVDRPTGAPAPLALTSVRVAGEPVSVGDGVELVAGRTDLEISFASLSFIDPEQLRYRYRVAPLDADWIDAGKSRSARIAHLPPGEYSFEFQGTNADNEWSPPLSLAIHVAPRWFETSWARGLLLLAIALGILGLYRGRLAVLRRRQRELEGLIDDRTRQLRQEREAAEEGRELIARQAAELQAMDHAKSRFFANISHEFRTPLTLMIGPLEDLRSGRYGTVEDRQGGQVSLALRSARAMLSLVDQLLDVARLDAGRLEIDRHPTDLTPFIGAMFARFQPLAERCELAFSYEDPGVPVPASVDVIELDKVVGNLLSNAFKYTPDGGEVTLSLAIRDATAVIAVRDTGPGIPADQLAHLFDRFYRTSTPNAAAAEGTGLGLAVSAEIVALHNGDLTVHSDVGEGAIFTVALPLVSSDALPKPTVEPALERATAPADAPLILVVDDNDGIRRFVRSVLEPELRVIDAADGFEGLSLARSATPDLILSDVMMPGKDGITLCRELKADPETDYIPVVLLTAKSGQASRLEGLESGADDYLLKPFEPRELRARIQNLVLARRKIRSEPQPTEPRPDDDLTSADSAYIQQVRGAIEEQLHDADFNVAALARAMGQDRSSLYRRVFALTSSKPSVLIRTLRLERAAKMLVARTGNVSEIAYGVGFGSLSSFSRAFKKHYGLSPRQYVSERS